MNTRGVQNPNFKYEGGQDTIVQKSSTEMWSLHTLVARKGNNRSYSVQEEPRAHESE